MIPTDVYKLAADGRISKEELSEIESLEELLSRSADLPAAVLAEKEARVFGESAPGGMSESSIPYRHRREAWKDYLSKKSKESATKKRHAVLGGALPGAAIGALAGGRRGGLAGAGVGALAGLGLRAADKARIRHAQKALGSSGGVDASLGKAVGRERRAKEERREARARQRHRETLSAISARQSGSSRGSTGSSQKSSAPKKPTYTCRYCDSTSASSTGNCSNCGAPKGGSKRASAPKGLSALVRRRKSQEKKAAMPAVSARQAGETVLSGALAGLGLYGASAAGAGIHHGLRAVVDKLTYRKDLSRVLAVHPEIAEEFSPKDINLVYRSIRTFSPEAAKDPLVGGRVLDSVLRNRDRMNPDSAPRFELGTAQELQRLRAGTDRGADMASNAFLAGARAAMDAQSDDTAERFMQAKELAQLKADLDLAKAMNIEDYKLQIRPPQP